MNTMTSGIRLSNRLLGRIRQESVLEAMRRIKRESFIDYSMSGYAADEVPLPIGYDQTTSSPFVIARMLEMLLASETMSLPATVLEIGVGCGYQTALLAELGFIVFGVERVKNLANSARRRLNQMGYSEIEIIHGDGHLGWLDKAPYDGIIVSAQCQQIPQQLLRQLVTNGRVVLPLKHGDSIRLTAVDDKKDIVNLGESVSFVPMKTGVE